VLMEVHYYIIELEMELRQHGRYWHPIGGSDFGVIGAS